MSFLTSLFGDSNKRVIDALRPLVDTINGMEERFSHLTNDELATLTLAFRERLAKDATLDDLLPEAFAAVREAAKRHLGQRHFDVQLMGGIVLHRGQIAEMRTGEGKTLTATSAVYVNALSGHGAHVVTVNDYLATRDAVWMARVYHALGMTVGCIQHEAAFLYDPDYTHQPSSDGKDGDVAVSTESFKIKYAFLRPCSRKEAYAADITYGTNNEFGFDYLRDNLVSLLSDKVQRDLHYAIVDEVDSILIDEARTPLIISAPAEESAELYYSFARLVSQLQEKEDYTVDEKMRAASLTEQGLEKIEKALGLGNVYTTQHLTLVHHIESALKAHALFKRDKEYVVKDDEVVIVDEFTGRLMYGRRYSEGLHQAIEAKENVKIQRESRTYATVTFQNLFRMYTKLAGMTGTAATEAEEFSKIYKLEVVVIPTNRPMVRTDSGDRVYVSEGGKLHAVVQDIKERHRRGQPLLVGTISIEKNELLGHLLEREGVPHEMLNAKNHEREATIIAQAGRFGAVTIATNMAGRGVDIILGGNPLDEEEAVKVREAGGLHVIGTERHESRRIDNQLRGRSGRQGDPGSTQFYLSLEDDLMRIFGSDKMKSLMQRLGLPEDMPIENKVVTRSIEEAQKKVETHNFDIRKHLVEYDDVINKHREIIYKRRKEVLELFNNEAQQGLREIIIGMVEGEVEHLVSAHTNSQGEQEPDKEKEQETLLLAVGNILPFSHEQREKLRVLIPVNVGHDPLTNAHSRTQFMKYASEIAQETYNRLEGHVAEQIKRVDPNADARLLIRRMEKDLLIRSIDGLWVEHLEAIDHLRQGIGLRGYGQRDPLVEYKRESYRMFTELLALIGKQVAYSIFKIGMAAEQMSPGARSALPRNAILMGAAKTAGEQQYSGGSSGGPKVGRNDPCPCGSGKKFKRCHGA